jgi:hypothetical protein
VTLASGRPYPNGIAVDGSNVYWTDGDFDVCGNSSVLKVPINGGSIATLVSAQECASGIAVDSTSVYWLNDGSAVMKATPK